MGIDSGHETTGLFIYPGYKFNVVDAMFTQFSYAQIKSSLSLFLHLSSERGFWKPTIGPLKQSIGFFSYGDAMLIL